jgi:hypothetical protein
MLDDLIRARVLVLQNGSYQFSYTYYLEYFVTRYYKDALQNPTEETKDLTAEIAEMADHVCWEPYSKILMFFLYFTRDGNLIQRLLGNAGEVFAKYAPATLDRDVDFANALYKAVPSIGMPSDSDFQAHREDRRKQMDESERLLPGPDDGKKVRYSENLSDNEKLEIAGKYQQLLGQILRNFPGSLRADVKLKIANATYLLGLRMLSVLLQLVGGAVEHYRSAFAEHLNTKAAPAEAPADPSEVGELSDLADTLYLLFTRLCVLACVKQISASVGSPELDQTYLSVLDSLPDSSAVGLVDLSIRLDHFRGFPEASVRQLHERLRKNTFTHHVLADLVVLHFMFFPVDTPLRQRIGGLLGFRASEPRFLDTRQKLLAAAKTTEK